MFVLNLNFAPLPGNANFYQTYYKNIFADLLPGANAFQLSGDELVNPMFKWKYEVNFNIDALRTLNNTGTGPMTVRWWLAVVGCNDQLGNTAAVTAYSSSQAWFIQENPFKLTFNGNNVRVYKKKVGQWHLPSIAPSATTSVSGLERYSGSMKFRLRKKCKYEDALPSSGGGYLQSVYLRGMNYYLVGGWAVPSNLTGSPLASPIAFSVDQYMYFKDP